MASGPAPHKPTQFISAGRGGGTKLNPKYTEYQRIKAFETKKAADNAARASAKLAALKVARGPEPEWVKANGLGTSFEGDSLYYTKRINHNGETYVLRYDTSGNYLGESHTGFDYNPLALILGVALSFALPGVGAAITESIVGAGLMSAGVAADAVGLAIANTAAGVAQGQPLDTALTNAVVGAVISTGSVGVAKDINTFVGNPAVTDIIVSAGGSAIKTAAAGGTEQDIINNMTGALAGSAASSAYQLGGEDFTRSTGRVIGSAVAGGVTGGSTGAITGALGELGGQAKNKVAGAIEDVISPEDTGALPASQVAAMTPTSDVEFETKTITFPRSTDITSSNIISPAASIAAPAAATLEPTGITDTEVMNAISSEKTPAAAAPAEEVVRREATASENAGFPLVEVTAQRLPPPPPDITSTDIIDAPTKLQDVTVTGKREETPLNVAAVEEPAVVEEPAAVAEEEQEPEPEEKPAADKPYKPNLFILGGTKAKPPPSKTPTSVLGQALGTTTGLTSSRGAGEIEGPSTGKKRKKVWNEETLRLKDALGV